jgi:NAD(P)-dependent dehydrogenase (short-subunit alcohol dehydrogenase family)/catechol 2,3-dioxygenase-like lactoylglutathione lyase family enzyme
MSILCSKASSSTAIAAALAGSAAILYLLSKKNKKKPSPRATSRVSHLRIQTRDLKQSIAFYKAIGLVLISSDHDDDTKLAVLKCPDAKRHQPYIVLVQEETTATAPMMNALQVGIGRFCLGVKDVHVEIDRLSQLGYQPIAPAVTDKPGTPDEHSGINKEEPVTIVAFRDPSSGAMVELVSAAKLTWPLKIIIPVLQLKFPLFVHVNVNASSFEDSLKAYRQLGFTVTSKDYGRVVNKLYQALEIPDPGIAKQVTLIQTPEDDLFCIDLIEWEYPSASVLSKQVIEGGSVVRFAITVEDLPNYVDGLVETNWSLSSSPRIEMFPAPLGPATVATVQDPDGVEVDIVSYPDVFGNELEAYGSGHGKVVLVTGCDSGFGRSLVCRIATLGFTVVAACYTKQGAIYLENLATTVVADLSTNGGVQAVVTKCKETLAGRGDDDEARSLWAVINNAGVCLPGNVEWQTPSTYKQCMDVNFHAPLSIVYELIPHLKEVKGGASRVIQVSSVCGLVSQPSNAPYCSSKHAIESFCDCLRAEMQPFLKVCIVQPATMRTPLMLSYWGAWKESYEKAPIDRQTSFSKDEVKQISQKQGAALIQIAEEPNVTVSAIVKALVDPDPPARIRTGSNGWFFYMLSLLPDKSRDTLSRSLIFGLNNTTQNQ